MQCTRCTEKVQPVVAIDIDGTLADYHGYFTEFSRRYLAMDGRFHSPDYDGSEPFRVWWCRTFGQEERTWRDCKLAYRQGGMKRSQPIYPGAYRLMKSLHQAGAEVWITTTRPYQRLDNIDPDTRFWLEQHEMHFDRLLYDDDKYRQLERRVDPLRVVAVLDDLPEQYDIAERLFGSEVPILRRSVYNREVTRPNEVHSLDIASMIIQDRISLWRQAHDRP